MPSIRKWKYPGIWNQAKRPRLLVLMTSFLLITGCAPRLEFNPSQEMSRAEMLSRASHVFIGVIQKHQFESWPFFRFEVPGDRGDAKSWRVLRREVRIETVLRGSETRKVVNVYEVSWAGGASGDWNSTHDGDRALFLLREERGRYHVVRDWWRSIFTVTTGPHTRLPLDDSWPLWERIALMNWWIERSDEVMRITYPYFRYSDPGGVLSLWRIVKLERGLVRHPSPGVRVPACRELLGLSGWGQDECWEALSDRDKSHLSDSGYLCCSASEVAENRVNLEKLGPSWWWTRFTTRDERRLLTAVSNRQRRAEFCALYHLEYPGDRDNGCPADQPPPATIVTDRGDVPLVGPWPR